MWIISFADMVILLMSFFVILLAGRSQNTTVDNEELLRILASIKTSFGYLPNPSSKDPIDTASMQIIAARTRASVPAQMKMAHPPDSEPATPRKPWMVAKGQVGRPVMFEAHSAKLTVESADALDEIAENLRNHFRNVTIQGHVAPDEARRDRDGGLWLAYQRAVLARAELERRAISRSRLFLVSCSDHYTRHETDRDFHRRAVITVGSYFLPGDDP